MDEQGEIICFTMVDNDSNSYTVDPTHPLVAPNVEYSVTWECMDVRMPAFIARFNRSYDQFFTTYPYQKNALIGFSFDSDQQSPMTYIDYDTNGDGQMIDFHGVDMDVINIFLKGI